MAVEKKVFSVGPGELKAASKRNAILRAPVLGSCIALFVYDMDGRAAGLAHVMYPSPARSHSMGYADAAVRGLAGKLTAMGAHKWSLAAALAARNRKAGMSRRIVDSIKAALAKEKIDLQAELYAQSKISASAQMDLGSFAITCSSRDGLSSTFLARNKYFSEILRKVARRTGFGLGGYRVSTLQRRMGLRMARVGAESYEAYAKFLDANPHEFDELLRTLAINVTGFFRDRKVFEAIRKTVLPALASKKRRLRAWSAGCATGEEAYSLAMLLEELRKRGGISSYSILATDLSSAALKQAREGAYEPNLLGEIPPYARKRVRISGEKLRMPGSLKKHMKFIRHDLTSRVFPKGFDLVLCRNVLIFYEPATRQRVEAKLAASLACGGYLVLGSSEASVGPSAVLGRRKI